MLTTCIRYEHVLCVAEPVTDFDRYLSRRRETRFRLSGNGEIGWKMGGLQEFVHSDKFPELSAGETNEAETEAEQRDDNVPQTGHRRNNVVCGRRPAGERTGGQQ